MADRAGPVGIDPDREVSATTAGLRVRREALGLSRAWIAGQLKVAENAVGRWESGARSIPDDVWDLLDEAEDRADILIASVLVGLWRIIGEATVRTGEPPDGVDVVTYPTDRELWSAHPDFEPWPASWHRAVLGRLRVELDPIPVTYHYGPTEG